MGHKRVNPRAVRILFTLTLFLSAALLFLVQPMVGKMVLPKFGGSPSVWNASMLFFQTALLAGYAYAHFASKGFGVRRHAWAHLVVLGLASLALPIALPAAAGQAGASAVGVIAALAVAVGAPFFVLSAGAPLLQRWFGETADPAAKDPYFLYAASNLGSMLALIAYPLWIEPTYRLGDQARLWTYGYGALALLMALCVGIGLRLPARTPAVAEVPVAEPEEASAPPTTPDILRWIGLAFVPSGLILATTTFLTANVAPVPLLWIVPLALYLLTFIAAFAKRPIPAWLPRMLAPVALFPVAATLVLEKSGPVFFVMPLHLAGFFLACLACHTELARQRPPTRYLTAYYLWISFGGALGGTFVALIAPVAFNQYLEYPILLALALAVVGLALKEDGPRWTDALVPVALLICVTALRYFEESVPEFSWLYVTGALLMVCALRPFRFGLAMAALFASAILVPKDRDEIIEFRERSFFGVHQVERTKGGSFRRLVHGNTLHGMQSLDPALAGVATSYYTRTGPVGDVMALFEKEPPRDFAVVGLGTGTMATYGRPGQTLRYYEIDPTIEGIARNPKFFTYLRDTRANVEVVIGDARLRLREAKDDSYSVLILDAFSSDAIPVHLLTQEAFELYKSKIAPDGIILVHISNRYLDLRPPVKATADVVGLRTLIRKDENFDVLESTKGKLSSEWVAMARSSEAFRGLEKVREWSPLKGRDGFRPWTDDYSNILSVLVR